jgi:GxxExxY protein
MQHGFPRLSDDLESLVSSTIGCCIRVHRALGPGLNEIAYAKACAIELESNGIGCEAERSIAIKYRDHVLCYQRIDLLVDDRLVLEVKSVDAIHPIHVAQVVAYLRVTGARVGLIANFNVEVLKHGLRRVIL